MHRQCTMVAAALLLHILIGKSTMIGLTSFLKGEQPNNGRKEKNIKGGDAEKVNRTKEYKKGRECKCMAVTNNY